MIAIVALGLASASAVRAAHRATEAAPARRRLPVGAPEPALHGEATRLGRALAAAAVEIPAETVGHVWFIAAFVGVAAALVAGGLPLATLVAVASALGPLVTLHLARGRRDRLIEVAMPGALEAMARTMRSGGSLRQAILETAAASAGPVAEGLRAVGDDLRDGVSIATALERWSAKRPLAGVRLSAAALTLGAETGGATAQAIDGVAETLRTNLAVAAEVRALSSQARMSALVIALAPLGFTLLAAATDGSTAAFLVRTRVGLACLCAGLGLDVLGGLWMRRLTAIAA